jgi:hypothetical protein
MLAALENEGVEQILGVPGLNPDSRLQIRGLPL